MGGAGAPHLHVLYPFNKPYESQRQDVNIHRQFGETEIALSHLQPTIQPGIKEAKTEKGKPWGQNNQGVLVMGIPL